MLCDVWKVLFYSLEKCVVSASEGQIFSGSRRARRSQKRESVNAIEKCGGGRCRCACKALTVHHILGRALEELPLINEDKCVLTDRL